jgi:ABC-type transport system involved in cytochrome c biogenesis permease subunit
MWFLFQALIIFAVVASNIHWQWTPNGYLAGLIGVVLAYGLTAALSELWRRSRRNV